MMRKLIFAIVVVIVILITWLLLRRPAPVLTYYESFEQSTDPLTRAKLAYNAPNPVHILGILGTPVTQNNIKLYAEYMSMRSYMIRYVSKDTYGYFRERLDDMALRAELQSAQLARASSLSVEVFEDILTTLRSFTDGYVSSDQHIFATTGLAYALNIPIGMDPEGAFESQRVRYTTMATCGVSSVDPCYESAQVSIRDLAMARERAGRETERGQVLVGNLLKYYFDN